MEKVRRLLLVGAILAAFLLAGSGAWRLLEPPGSTASTPAVAGPRVEESQTTAAWGRSWTPGLQYVYAIDFQQALAMGRLDSDQEPMQSLLRVRVAGDYTSTVVGTSDRGVALRLTLAATQLELNLDGEEAFDPTTRAQIVQALGEPVYAMVAHDGQVRAVYHSPHVDPGLLGVYRSLVSTMQVVLPESPAEEWTTEEEDPTGRFKARYSRVPDTSEVEKVRTSYLQMVTPAGLQPIDVGVQVQPSGLTRARLDARMWVEWLEADEVLYVRPAATSPPVRGTTRLQVQKLAEGFAPDLVGTFGEDLGQLVLSPMAVPSLVQDDADAELRTVLAGGTLSSLTSELELTSVHESDGGPETARLMTRLEALLLLEPDRAARIPGIIASTGDRNVYSSLIGALSSASTPEAIRALAETATNEDLQEAIRVDATAGLGTAPRPTAEGLAALKELARAEEDALRSVAILGLGTTGKHLRENGDPLADGLVSELLDDARRADDARSRLLRLSAVANTADPAALPLIARALQEESVEIRAGAVAALRIIDDEGATRMLSRQMLADSSAEVRRSAVFASSFRPIEPLLPALAELLTSDPEPRVRLDVVRVIGERREQIPNAGDILRVASELDSDLDVRTTASAFLDAIERAERDRVEEGAL